MDWGFLTSLILIAVSLTTFAIVTGVSLGHFARKDGIIPTGSIIIMLAAVASVAVFAWCAWTAPLWLLPPLPLYAASLALFIWTVRATRQRQFLLAFTNAVPSALTIDGPYKFVRHPFYVSYLIYHFANAVGTASWLPWVMFAAMTTIYTVAARGEEAFLAQGSYAKEYGAYRRRTGMFVPKFWLSPSAGNTSSL